MRNKILTAGGIAGALSAIIALTITLGFKPVFAAEFYDFKAEYYSDKLDDAEDDLTDIKIDIYREEKKTGDVPPFLIKKKSDLENGIEEIKRELEKAEASE